MSVLTQKIYDWRITYGHIKSDLHNLANHFFYAAGQCEAESWAGLANSFYNMEFYMRNACQHFRGGSPDLYTTMYAAMDWIDDNWPDGDGEVTMDAILTAMITSDFAQLQTFVGLVDAYRVALWNEPFNAEYYAALARGFMP